MHQPFAFTPAHPVQLWDNIMGSVWNKDCFCAKCSRERGERSPEAWKAVQASLPDYSVLLKPAFWKAHPLIAPWFGKTA
jgi:hypothetical protein